MAIIAQRNLFSWKEIDDLGDLERLCLLLEHLPDEELMLTLEEHRGRGRDDYPVRPCFHCHARHGAGKSEGKTFSADCEIS